jgi:hypothetical protein
MHCFSLVCSSQVDQYVDNCIAGVNPDFCDASIAAIDACLASASPAQETMLAECFDSVAGPAGCFACDRVAATDRDR